MNTEEEAKTKWCPFARGLAEIGSEDGAELIAGANRSADGAPHIECRCIASECMAWRWFTNPVQDPEFNGRHVGYCSLAGKPE